MRAADAIIFGLLTVADLAFLAHLRLRRGRRVRQERMMRSLHLAIQREIAESAFNRRKPWQARRAS